MDKLCFFICQSRVIHAGFGLFGWSEANGNICSSPEFHHCVILLLGFLFVKLRFAGKVASLLLEEQIVVKMCDWLTVLFLFSLQREKNLDVNRGNMRHCV